MRRCSCCSTQNPADSAGHGSWASSAGEHTAGSSGCGAQVGTSAPTKAPLAPPNVGGGGRFTGVRVPQAAPTHGRRIPLRPLVLAFPRSNAQVGAIAAGGLVARAPRWLGRCLRAQPAVHRLPCSRAPAPSALPSLAAGTQSGVGAALRSRSHWSPRGCQTPRPRLPALPAVPRAWEPGPVPLPRAGGSRRSLAPTLERQPVSLSRGPPPQPRASGASARPRPDNSRAVGQHSGGGVAIQTREAPEAISQLAPATPRPPR